MAQFYSAPGGRPAQDINCQLNLCAKPGAVVLALTAKNLAASGLKIRGSLRTTMALRHVSQGAFSAYAGRRRPAWQVAPSGLTYRVFLRTTIAPMIRQSRFTLRFMPGAAARHKTSLDQVLESEFSCVQRWTQ